MMRGTTVETVIVQGTESDILRNIEHELHRRAIRYERLQTSESAPTIQCGQFVFSGREKIDTYFFGVLDQGYSFTHSDIVPAHRRI